ncbi:MAG: cell division protein FtsZ [Rhodospirillaceae bacterium]|nr:cell division protein FtsZ [Rhodospirillaceae bacterium]|tara:strand:+ start:502 stop:2157 length:1656 start_codon:yes stop_codon:yes gene_type:complete
MTINLSIPEPAELHPKITVIGVGGAGGNAVNNMIDADLGGVEFMVLNTDSQSLSQSLAERRIQLGVGVTQGLGAGSNPEVGKKSAEESLPEIMEALSGSHMVFITAGMGGGTGSGASPVIAKACREAGILTVGVITKPFQFEGAHRMSIAEAGTKSLEECVDTLIIIPNQNLFRVANEKTTFADAFKMADDVLYSGVRSVTDLMVMPGLINLDFADVRSIMMEMGKAMMGTGESSGENRAIEAAEAAIANPLLDDVSMKGARGVLINITGGPDMTLYEVDEAANRIRDEVDPDANIIFGSIFETDIEGKIRVSVVATGIEKESMQKPTIHSLYSDADENLNSQTISNSASFGIRSQTPLAKEVNSKQKEDEILPQKELVMDQTINQEEKSIESNLEDRGDSFVEDTNESVYNDYESSETEAFVPPPAIKPGGVEEELDKPDPFAEAALANSKSEPLKQGKKSSALLDKMVSVSLRKKDSNSENVAPEKIEPTLERSEDTLDLEDKLSEEMSQSNNMSNDPISKGAESEGDLIDEPSKDLLEIPAFLRRQAN